MTTPPDTLTPDVLGDLFTTITGALDRTGSREFVFDRYSSGVLQVSLWDDDEELDCRTYRLVPAAEAAESADALDRLDLFALLLAGAREGLARSGSRAKGVRQVQDMLTEHAGAIHRAATDANRRRERGKPPEDRGKAASEALSRKDAP